MRVLRNFPDEYLKRVESVSILENGRIQGVVGKVRIGASTEKHSLRVLEKVRISVSTKKLWNLGEYREKVESVRVLRQGRIGASTERLSQ